MKKKCILIIKVLIILFIIFKLIPMLILWIWKPTETVKISSEVLKYDIRDLINYIVASIEYDIDIVENNSVLYNQNYTFYIKNSSEEIELEDYVEYTINSEHYIATMDEKQKNIQLTLKEGKNELDVKIKNGDNIKKHEQRSIYYVEPYQKQFLDEFSNKGTVVHYRDGRWEKYENTIDLLLKSGVKNVRSSFIYKTAVNGNGFKFDYYDKWVPILTQNNINIIACVTGMESYAGSDNKINSEEEVELVNNFAKSIFERYPQIKDYEIFNEPNNATSVYNNQGYVTPEYYYWYAKTIQTIKQMSEQYDDINIISGSAWNPISTIDTDKSVAAKTFFNGISMQGAYEYSDAFSYHPYDWSVRSLQNSVLKQKIIDNSAVFNEKGGFVKQYITEYGISSYNVSNITEELQAEMLIQQSIIADYFGIDMAIQYNFWNVGNSLDSREYNFGLLHNDCTPKLSYYAMKNYYENTNGAEYIGTVNLADGIEAHVYNKDGKPKIICWMPNIETKVNINYDRFTASDMYGNELENEDGTLTITSSPVYLDNISTKYFYEAISNTVLEKYAEFEEKFNSEIEQVEGLQEQIDKLKDYMTSIKDNTTETQEKSIEMMHEHFYLGTMVLDAFSKEKLNVEYVKVSSMLDMLNDIGDSYEDLLTVSATSREAYYTATEELINKAETTINNNSDLNILYPSKILDFAKELHEKSEYIIGIEEENDIKTGLIVSNSLHAYYLADWANDFANIYVNKYIKQNPVAVSYSNTDEFTNQDVTVTLNIGSDSKVTNNEGKNTYTFTKNGTFTFEYERRGQAFGEKVTITSIDKEAPTISGVANGKIYTDSATPTISDDNLEKIEVLFNGMNIQFNSGNTLKDEGIYNITATDKAGNVTFIEMYIVEKGEEAYIIENGYILNVKQKTTVNNFATKFNLSSGYTIKRNDKTISNKDIIATGDTLQLKNGAEYTIVVAGDINKDGKVTTYDLSTFRRYILGLREFDELESLAADINVDKQALEVKDYTRMRIEILGKY